jgi:N6-adenosine-specific RNA methylase IME4
MVRGKGAEYARRYPGGLFDETPIVIGGFRLKSRSAEPIGEPTLDGWTTALQFATAAERSSPYWIGDLLGYSASRAEWRARLDQAIAVSGLAEQTLHNLTHIAKRVQGRARELAPTVSHAAEVAALDPDEQVELLESAATEGWTVTELRRARRLRERPAIVEGQGVLEGRHRVIYADPAWKYDDSSVPTSGAFGKASRHYPGMTVEEICKLPVRAHVEPSAVLFLWVTSPMLPEAFPVIDAWGFTYKSSIVWDKVLGNWGHYVRVQHELLLVATRGSCLPDVPTPMPSSVQTIRRSDVHSEKPEEFRKLIERLYTRGPYLELFARKPVEGWTTFGNDARLWGDTRAIA